MSSKNFGVFIAVAARITSHSWMVEAREFAAFGVWRLAFGVWRLAFQVYRHAIQTIG
jgi:hypothetical protein